MKNIGVKSETTNHIFPNYRPVCRHKYNTFQSFGISELYHIFQMLLDQQITILE